MYSILFIQTEVAPRRIFHFKSVQEHVISDYVVSRLELNITDTHVINAFVTNLGRHFIPVFLNGLSQACGPGFCHYTTYLNIFLKLFDNLEFVYIPCLF